jgi:hypothetical protein
MLSVAFHEHETWPLPHMQEHNSNPRPLHLSRRRQLMPETWRYNASTPIMPTNRPNVCSNLRSNRNFEHSRSPEVPTEPWFDQAFGGTKSAITSKWVLGSETDCPQTLSQWACLGWRIYQPDHWPIATVPINDWTWSHKQSVHPDHNIVLPTKSYTNLFPLSSSSKDLRFSQR